MPKMSDKQYRCLKNYRAVGSVVPCNKYCTKQVLIRNGWAEMHTNIDNEETQLVITPAGFDAMIAEMRKREGNVGADQLQKVRHIALERYLQPEAK
jgi:hypothetical protein